MAGIFGGHIFEGFGQTPPADMTFTLEETEAATRTAPKSGGSAYIPPSATGSKSGAAPAYIPGAPAPSAAIDTYAAAPAGNTALYVAGGVAVVGLLAVLMMSGGRRGTVTANRRGRRGRRSRSRRSR